MHDAGGDEEDWHAESSQGTVSPRVYRRILPTAGNHHCTGVQGLIPSLDAKVA